MSNYLKIAHEVFPSAVRILGDGRWACSTADGSIVYLAATEQQRSSICLGIESPKKVDLKYPTCPKLDLPDDWEDRQRERREARRQ
jgi:hypothetical protein